MQQNKLKKLAMLCIFLCANGIPEVVYAKDIKKTEEIVQQNNTQTKVKIEENWLTKEVSKQLGKNVKNLTEQDLLNIKKIDLRYKDIKDEIPNEIKLLNKLTMTPIMVKVKPFPKENNKDKNNVLCF